MNLQTLMPEKDTQSVDDNIKSGYIKIYRSVLDHYIFKEKQPFSKREAWIDLLLKVNFKPNKVMIAGQRFDLERGETIRSLDTWANDWRWDKSKVRRFLTLLQHESMIRLTNEKFSTRITICNYDTYQLERNGSDTRVKRQRHGSDTAATPNNNDKKISNESITVPNGTVVGLPGANPTGVMSFESRCIKFIDAFNSTKIINGKPSKYQVTGRVKEKLKARLSKYHPNKIIIAIKQAMLDKHHVENNFIYLTPEYILREEIIERYLNADMKPKDQVYTASPVIGIDHTKYEPVTHPPAPYNPQD